MDGSAQDVVAVVMAGGMGERLRPLTDVRAKPAVPFAGIHRIIDFSLSNCINSEIFKIFVLTQYKSQSLSQHLKEGWGFLSRHLDQFIDEIPAQMQIGTEWYKGTANSIRQNMGFIQNYAPRLVLVLSGDHVYKMDYRSMIDYHDKVGAAVTLAVCRVDAKAARRRFGVVEANEDGRLVSFKEKPAHPKRIRGSDQCYASMGVYLFNYETLKEMLRDDPRDFGRGIFSKAGANRDRIFTYDFTTNSCIPEYEYITRDGVRTRELVERASDSDYWRDIGTIEAYWRAHLDLVATTPRFNLYGQRWKIFGAPIESPPAKFVHESAERTGIAINSIVSNGVIVSGSTIRNSVLAPHVYVHSHAQVDNSILLGGSEIGGISLETSIGRHCRVRNAIIDKNVLLSSNVTVGFDRAEDERRGLTTYPLELTDDYIVVVPRNLTL